MLFNTFSYWVFLLIVFILYWWLNKLSRINLRNSLVLLSSYYFYGSWDERFLLLIIASSLVDYLCGKHLFRASKQSTRKLLLGLSLVFNLGLLGFFKYFNFFIDSFSDFIQLFGLSANPSTLSIILPVGISFYTFQTLSYTIDIYRKKLEPVSNPLTFFAFVAFFPQLVAGPIERASNLLPQLQRKQIFDSDDVVAGFRFILWGLFKKVVIADRLSFVVEQVYNHPAEFSGLNLFVTTILFGIQIYCDFSGYSDIAIGSARLLGIRLMDNFRTPYFSTSFREFWQRWHISLSTWFRDYIYIPLGGNRVSQARLMFNLFITFLISGFWHGANYTFLIWGALHGLFLVFEKVLSKANFRLPSWVKGIFVFTMVNLFWIFFRAQDLNEAFVIVAKIFSFADGASSLWNIVWLNDFEFGLSMLLGLSVFIIGEIIIGSADVNQAFFSMRPLLRRMTYYLILVMIFVFGVLQTAPQFIYFQF
ncbi:MAG: MBOAT family protein [Prolixibacteraceae bacterium]